VPLVVANGRKLHVQSLGAGPPVVMLHGLLLGNLTTWYFTAAPVIARTHRVTLYDLCGHGRSEHRTTGYDVASMSRDLADLTAKQASEPLTLIGHSYGALIALRFALDYPQRVKRLALVEAPLPPSRIHEFRDFLSRPPQGMVAALPRELQCLLKRGSRQALRLLKSLQRLATDSTLIRDLLAERDIPDAELARLDCPVALLYGDRSSCRAVGDRLARVIPNATLTMLPGGHYLHLDCARQMTERLVEFVNA
jgi:pimeloyl-ACP methyl ester carboxylesterase